MSKKTICSSLVAALVILPGLLFLSLFLSQSPLLFLSRESKTQLSGELTAQQGDTVFNRVQFRPGPQQDLWLMQQHAGPLDSNFAGWDRLVIVVDKTTKPYVAKFYQLESGEGEPDLARTVPLKARCYACHANGPRAIRFDSAQEPGVWNRARIAAWNLRIKTYGHVKSEAGTDALFPEAPFRAEVPLLSAPLPLKTCERCHSDSGGLRSRLRLEHTGTAAFLVRTGEMPPFPWQATPEERQLLEEYAKRF